MSKYSKRRTRYSCRYPQCSHTSTEKSRLEIHNNLEHFLCWFCGSSSELYTSQLYHTHLSSHHEAEIKVFHPIKTARNVPCTFAPRCPYKGIRPNTARHSGFQHLECPVNGCDAFLTMSTFRTHVREKHSDQWTFQCPRDGCSFPDVRREEYWAHGISHIHAGDEDIFPPLMGRCVFAPRCPFKGDRHRAVLHSSLPHLECPVNGCDAFLTKPTFRKHIRGTHGNQFIVQCPRDACCRRVISLVGYWHHALGHINKGDEESIQGICADVEPETAGEPPLSLEEFLAMNDSGSRGMAAESWLENPLSLEELLAMNEVGARGMEQEDWFNATKWNDDWDMLGQ